MGALEGADDGALEGAEVGALDGLEVGAELGGAEVGTLVPGLLHGHCEMMFRKHKV